MASDTTTTGNEINLLALFSEILILAAQEPGTIDDARDSLNAIEDKATAALLGRRGDARGEKLHPDEPGDGELCPCCGDFILPGHACA